ncbi:MAG: ATPase [Solibacillus sp.]|jgi:hypothetical protein|uniref:ATPase n=1 Tax=unclassified Solibacillus TaxID=2637870 RepID=UPI0030F8F439
MHTQLDSADCMYLIPEERFQRFCELIKELEFFTLVLPVVKDTYQRSITILDIWYLISTDDLDKIENPENAMIYPYRYYLLSIVKGFSIKRFIQLALYENDKLAFICAIYLYKGMDEFIAQKLHLDEEMSKKYKELQQYNTKSNRHYYDTKYQEPEKYPKQLAQLQSLVVNEIKLIHQKFKTPLNLTMENMITESENIYEGVFGLINDWGGRVP